MQDAQPCGLCDCYPCRCGTKDVEVTLQGEAKRVRIGDSVVVFFHQNRLVVQCPKTWRVSVVVI